MIQKEHFMSTKDRLSIAAIVSLSMLISCSCGKNSSPTSNNSITPITGENGSVIASSAPRAGRLSINGDDYFPHNPGRTWVLKNEVYPERITTISMVVSNGALAMYFAKNHPDTYHGFANTNLLWYLSDDRGWIYPTNTNTGEPDDIRYDRDSGKETVRTWLHTTDSTPVCFLIPSGSFTVPMEKSGTNSYYSVYANGFTGTVSGGLWFVRWSMVGELLRIQFNETYTDNHASIYEDWYLRRGVGIVGIRQYYDDARTSFRRGVSSEVLPR